MPWVRLDDQFPDHPKIVAAGPAAAWLYVCGLAYCARLLTDGFIPTGQVRKLADVPNAMKLAETLVKTGLWQASDEGFIVHDFLEYNPSSDKVRSEREAAKERMRNGRSQNVRANINGTTGEVPTNNERSSPVPFPYPEESPPSPPSGGDTREHDGQTEVTALLPKRSRREQTTRTAAPAEFPLTAERLAYAAEYGLSAAQAAFETEQFLDRNRAKGERYQNWEAAWRSWIRNTQKYQPRPITALPRFPSQADLNRGGTGKVVL